MFTHVTIVTIVRISRMTLNVNTQIDYKSIICKWWEIRTQHTHTFMRHTQNLQLETIIPSIHFWFPFNFYLKLKGFRWMKYEKKLGAYDR